MGCYSVLKQLEAAHSDAIWSVCWVNPSSLITGSLDTTAKVWNLQNQGGECRLTEDRVFDGFVLGIISVDVAPQTSTVAIAAMDSKIRLFDLDKPIETCDIKTIDAGPVESWKVKFSPDSKIIATGSISGKINLYSTAPEDDNKSPKVQFDAGKFVYSVDFVSIILCLIAKSIAFHSHDIDKHAPIIRAPMVDYSQPETWLVSSMFSI